VHAIELPFQFSGLRPTRIQHLICMKVDAMRLNAIQAEVMQLHAVEPSVVRRQRDDMDLRSPAEPSPPPIQEPPNPPENPDVPVREPDPAEPNQI
jgi:hypothetical protein